MVVPTTNKAEVTQGGLKRDSNPRPFSTKCGGPSVVPTTTLRAKKGPPLEEPKGN
jgi:hypothetical protein